MRANKNARAAGAGGRISKCLNSIAYQIGLVKEKRGDPTQRSEPSAYCTVPTAPR